MSDDDEDLEHSEHYDENEDEEYRNSHANNHGPSCMDSPSEAPAECRNQLPFHKRVVFQLLRIRRRLLRTGNRS